MYDAPGIFYALWKVVSPFVDSVTKAKIDFVDGRKALELFKEVVGMEVSTVFCMTPVLPVVVWLAS